MEFTDTDRLNALEQMGNASIWYGQWASHVKDRAGQPIVEICEADEDCLPAEEVARGTSLREALDMLIAGRSNAKDQASAGLPESDC